MSRWTRVAVPLTVLGLVSLLAAVAAAHPTSVTTGSARVRSCTNTAHLTLNPGYSARDHAYVVKEVTVRAAAGCGGMTYELTLSGGSQNLAQATGQLDAGGGAVASFLPANVAAAQVTNIGLTLISTPPASPGQSTV